MHYKLYQEVKNATVNELYKAAYIDTLTGLHNRAAYDKVPHGCVAFIDLDSLKYINDTLGHRAGDSQLQALATLLNDTFGLNRVFRIGGDELVVISKKHCDELSPALHMLRASFPGFSFGTGHDLSEADHQLYADKKKRELSGERATRGAAPHWASRLRDLL